MALPEYKVEISSGGSTFEEVIDQLFQNGSLEIGGGTVGSGSVNQTSQDGTKTFGQFVAPTAIVVDNCDSITGWVELGAELSFALETTTKKEGTASIKLGKDGTSTVFGGSHSSIGPFDFVSTTSEFFVWVWIKDTATLNKLRNSGAFGATLIVLSSPGNRFDKGYYRSNLSIGWNKLGGALSAFTTQGSPDVNSLANIQLSFNSNNVGDLITSGDMLMDYFHGNIIQDVILNDCESLTPWSFAPGWGDSLSLNSSIKKQGTYSIIVRTTGDFRLSAQLDDIFDLNGVDFEGWFYVRDATVRDEIANITIYLADGDFDNYTGRYAKQIVSPIVGWNSFTGSIPGDFSLQGAEVKSKISHILIWVHMVSSATVWTADQFLIDWFHYGLVQKGITDVGQSFITTGGNFLDNIHLMVGPVGSPSDSVQLKLYDNLRNLIATSDTQTPGSMTETTFTFSSPLISPTATYIMTLERTGAEDPLDYWEVQFKDTTNPYVDGIMSWIDNEVIVEDTGADLWFKINYGTFFDAVAQSFVLLNYNSSVLDVTVYVEKVGSPPDNLRVSLLDENHVWLITSTDIKGGIGAQTFTFNYALLAGATYYFVVERTGSPNAVNYWKIQYHQGDLYADGQAERRQGGTWTEFPNDDLKFSLSQTVIAPDVDITTDVFEITTNTGKNDFGGDVQRGTCDIIVANLDGKFNINNTESSLFGIYDLLKKIRISATYESINYYNFTGFVTRSKPELRFEDHVVHIVLEDLFRVLDTEVVSIGLQTTKTATELITALLVAAGLTVNDYILDADDGVELKTVTWNDVNVLEKLKTIIEAGQHHHFIDAQGRYVFKNNQWLVDDTPKYVLTKINVDDAVIDDDLSTLRNKVIVNYAATSATATDQNSVNKYGLYEHTIDNELMPIDGVYAQAIADRILALDNVPGTTLDLTLRERFPEVLDLTFGDIAQFIHVELNIDDIYTVLAVTHRIVKGGLHGVTYKCKKWVEPLTVASTYTIEPIVGDEWLDLADTTTAIAQSFRVTSNGYLYQLELNLMHDLEVQRPIRLILYAADGSGFPTGSPLAYSAFVNFPDGATSGTYLFTFDDTQRPLLTTGNDYVVVFDTPLTQIITGGPPGSLVITGDNYKTNINGLTSQSFVAPENLDLENVEIDVKYNLGTGVNLFAYLYAESGDLPTGAVIATSNAVNKSGSGFDTLTFVFGTPPTLVGGTKYVVVIDTPSTTLTGQSWRPFTGNQDILGENLCTDGELLMLRQHFFMPVAAAILQVNFRISSCAEPIVLQIYEGGVLKATSTATDDGNFLFPSGERPILVAGIEYRLRMVIPVPCRAVGGFSIKGSGGNVVAPDFTYMQCVGGFVVGKPWDLDFELFFDDYPENAWEIWASSGNSYSAGRAGRKQGAGAWNLFGSNVDFAFTFNYTSGVSVITYINQWQVWGDAAGGYANGKAAAKNGAWATKHPWDFYFKAKIIEA